VSDDSTGRSEFALALLEATVAENHQVMNRLATDFSSVAGDIHALGDSLSAETTSTSINLEAVQPAKLESLKSSMADIINALQFVDTAEQRMQHVLILLREPKTPLAEVLSDRTEWQLARSMGFETPDNVPASQSFGTSGGVDLFLP